MSSDAQEPYIFTTLRYDDALRTCTSDTAASEAPSSIYLLTRHHTRLRQAGDEVFHGQGLRVLEKAGLPSAQSLETVVHQAVQEERIRRQDSGITHQNEHTAYRVRLQCDTQGRLSISLAPIPTLSASSLYPQSLALPTSDPSATEWVVHLARHATAASTGTPYKTNDRSAYDLARSDAGIQSLAAREEVLLYDKEGRVMDASITTPYFCRGGHWVTPAGRFGGQLGTTRSWALEQALCTEGTIEVASLSNGEIIWLSNAARGFFQGVVKV